MYTYININKYVGSKLQRQEYPIIVKCRRWFGGLNRKQDTYITINKIIIIKRNEEEIRK